MFKSLEVLLTDFRMGYLGRGWAGLNGGSESFPEPRPRHPPPKPQPCRSPRPLNPILQEQPTLIAEGLGHGHRLGVLVQLSSCTPHTHPCLTDRTDICLLSLVYSQCQIQNDVQWKNDGKGTHHVASVSQVILIATPKGSLCPFLL